MVLNRCVILHFSCPRVQVQGSKEGKDLACTAQLPKAPLLSSMKEPEPGTKAHFWKGLWGFSRNKSIQLENSIPCPAAQGQAKEGMFQLILVLPSSCFSPAKSRAGCPHHIFLLFAVECEGPEALRSL